MLKDVNKYKLTLSSIIIVYYAAITAWPILYNIYLSFTKSNLLEGSKFVGFKNYVFLINDPVFWVSLWHNIFYILIMVPAGIFISLIVAALIYKTYGVAKKIYTALFFAPVVTSMVAVSLLWSLLYFPKIGFFSVVLTKLFNLPPQLFLADPKIALLCIIIMDIWKDTGLRAVILLAGMGEIPDSLYEASKIDGASQLSQFFKITIPLLRPQILFLAAIYSINALRVFAPIYMMTGNPPGGPANSTKTLAIQMYQEAFRSLRFGYGAVISLVIFILLFGIVLVEIRSFQQQWEY
jgi:ABC-type sugar transport system permease subunit